MEYWILTKVLTWFLLFHFCASPSCIFINTRVVNQALTGQRIKVPSKCQTEQLDIMSVTMTVPVQWYLAIHFPTCSQKYDTWMTQRGLCGQPLHALQALRFPAPVLCAFGCPIRPMLKLIMDDSDAGNPRFWSWMSTKRTNQMRS